MRLLLLLVAHLALAPAVGVGSAWAATAVSADGCEERYQEIAAAELIPENDFKKFPDQLTPQEFSHAIRGHGTVNDPAAVSYVSDGLIHSPPPGVIHLEETMPWSRRDADPLRLLTIEQFRRLPNGTVLEAIDGWKGIKGVDDFDLDTRGGFLAFGFRRSTFKPQPAAAYALPSESREQLEKMADKVSRLAQNSRQVDEMARAEARQKILGASEKFAAARAGLTLEQTAQNEGYQELKYSFAVGLTEPEKGAGNVGKEVMARYRFRADGPEVELRGTIVKEYGAGINIQDEDGVIHALNGNYGKIEKTYVRSAASPGVRPEYVSPELAQARRGLKIAEKDEADLRDVLVNGKPLLSFKDPAEKSVFYKAAQEIRQQPVVVEKTRDAALRQNIAENHRLGREPQRIDANGIPRFAPGPSFFRAMVIAPENKSVAEGILRTSGWKSGFDRGVKISPEKIGQTGFGASRLSELSRFEDSVVEFVGPKLNLGPRRADGFAFPKDSRVVGTATTSEVVEVAKKTSGESKPGSFVMVTEIVPRNRKLVNSNQLLKGRGLEPKYPTVYSDGGVEHAVSGVEVDEIVNVIFIPMN